MKRLWWLTLAAVLPVRADVFTVDVQGEVQKQDLLCWAAVSVMAMRAFDPPPTQKRQPSQRDVVLYRGIKALPPACTGPNDCPDPEEVTSIDDCAADLSGGCNFPSFPWLFDLTSRFVMDSHPDDNLMLTAATISHEIGNRERPVLIQWEYLDPGEMTPQERAAHRLPPEPVESEDAPRTGKHALIITGYDSGKNEVRVWDPWPPMQPVAESEESSAPAATHEKWIPYDRYANPLNDEGAAVAALHAFDQFALCRDCTADDTAFFKDMDQRLTAVPEMEAAEPTEVSFISGPPNVEAAVKGFLSGHTVRDRSGNAIQGSVRADLAIPIVAISTARLLGARREPESLLQPNTSAIVVPVMKGKRLVDSFLLLHRNGRWVEGGYSNNEIARRLVDLRARFTARNRAASGFYLVSIPEQGTFYLAHGFQGNAQMVWLGQLGQGSTARMSGASRLLRSLIGEIQAPRSRHSLRERRTPN